jgi:hypothetical protein
MPSGANASTVAAASDLKFDAVRQSIARFGPTASAVTPIAKAARKLALAQ